ncbi:hypothetical protein Tco_1005910 [Tanacetum coccineum]|uniref:Uncharacterized protein n=1 Tax=Tanacetum coccineum TaxID=301880 RepID=A0ABQ5FIK2_9ASTR
MEESAKGIDKLFSSNIALELVDALSCGLISDHVVVFRARCNIPVKNLDNLKLDEDGICLCRCSVSRVVVVALGLKEHEVLEQAGAVLGAEDGCTREINIASLQPHNVTDFFVPLLHLLSVFLRNQKTLDDWRRTVIRSSGRFESLLVATSHEANWDAEAIYGDLMAVKKASNSYGGSSTSNLLVVFLLQLLLNSVGTTVYHTLYCSIRLMVSGLISVVHFPVEDKPIWSELTSFFSDDMRL